MSFFLLLSFIGSNIVEASVKPIEIVFMCTTEKGNKTISLFKQGEYFIYQYGLTLGKPEISLAVKEAEVIKEPWNGVGNYMWNNITLKNGEYSYTIRSSYVRNTEFKEAKDNLGVDISKGDSYISSVKCKTDHYIDQISSFVE